MLTQVLALVAQIAPALGNVEAIGSVITMLEGFIQLATDEIRAVTPEIKNIIAALQSNGNITADQMIQLEALDQATDDAFEDAAKAAGADPDPNAT